MMNWIQALISLLAQRVVKIQKALVDASKVRAQKVPARVVKAKVQLALRKAVNLVIPGIPNPLSKTIQSNEIRNIRRKSLNPKAKAKDQI